MEEQVPEMRFDEFEDIWKKEKLKSFCHKIMVGIASSATHAYVDEGIPMIRNQNIKESGLDDSDLLYIDSEYEIQHKNKRLKAGDVLTVRTGYPGLSCLVPEKYENAQCFTSLIVRPKKDLVHSGFLVQYMNSPIGKSIMAKLEAGGAQKNINSGSLEHFLFPWIDLAEQQKIADFLSAVDRKIELLTRKKEMLEQYKKGVMQKLFPKPGERHPELRFKQKDGSNFPDWEVKRFDQIATIKMGQSPDSNSYNDQADGLYLIQGNADIKDRETSPRQWTSEPTKTCREGDLILTVRAPVGYICKSKHKACIGRGVCSITGKGSNDQNYFYQYLLKYEPYWVRLEQGSTFTAVSGSDIKSLKIPVPIYLEQQSISIFLTHIDQKIKSVTLEFDKAQTFKKGLLQQMFV